MTQVYGFFQCIRVAEALATTGATIKIHSLVISTEARLLYLRHNKKTCLRYALRDRNFQKTLTRLFVLKTCDQIRVQKTNCPKRFQRI